jgi:non-specific serine/threonine protein kinase
MVVDGSLATAVSKLRKAMGDDDHPVIATVPRVGYRLAVPVYCNTVAAPSGPELGFKAGEVVRGRAQWRLPRAMEISGSSEVWLAENPKTREQRVFKFAADGARLKGLKREIHDLSVLAGVTGRPAGVCPHPGVEFCDVSVLSRERVRRAKPGRMVSEPYHSASI